MIMLSYYILYSLVTQRKPVLNSEPESALVRVVIINDLLIDTY